MAVHRLPDPEPRFDLRAAVRELLANGKPVDPHDVTKKLIGVLPNSVIDDLVWRGAYEMVCHEIRLLRVHTPGPSGPSRWDRHRVIVEGLGDRIRIAGQWESLADCTAAMLDTYAGEQDARAEELRGAAKRAADLAAQIRAAGVKTVADLGPRP